MAETTPGSGYNFGLQPLMVASSATSRHGRFVPEIFPEGRYSSNHRGRVENFSCTDKIRTGPETISITCTNENLDIQDISQPISTEISFAHQNPHITLKNRGGDIMVGVWTHAGSKLKIKWGRREGRLSQWEFLGPIISTEPPKNPFPEGLYSHTYKHATSIDARGVRRDRAEVFSCTDKRYDPVARDHLMNCINLGEAGHGFGSHPGSMATYRPLIIVRGLIKLTGIISTRDKSWHDRDAGFHGKWDESTKSIKWRGGGAGERDKTAQWIYLGPNYDDMRFKTDHFGSVTVIPPKIPPEPPVAADEPEPEQPQDAIGTSNLNTPVLSGRWRGKTLEKAIPRLIALAIYISPENGKSYPVKRWVRKVTGYDPDEHLENWIVAMKRIPSNYFKLVWRTNPTFSKELTKLPEPKKIAVINAILNHPEHPHNDLSEEELSATDHKIADFILDALDLAPVPEPEPEPIEQTDGPEMAAAIKDNIAEDPSLADENLESYTHDDRHILELPVRHGVFEKYKTIYRAIPLIIAKHPDWNLARIMRWCGQVGEGPNKYQAPILERYILKEMRRATLTDVAPAEPADDPDLAAGIQASELEDNPFFRKIYEDQLAAAIAASTQPNSFPEGDYYFGGRAINCAEKVQVGPQSFIMQCVPSVFIGWEEWLPGESLTIEGNSITMKNKHGTYEGEWNPDQRTIEWKKDGSPTLHRKWWYDRPGPVLEIDPVSYKSPPSPEPAPEAAPTPIVEGQLVEHDDSVIPIQGSYIDGGGSKKKKAKSSRKYKKKIKSSKGSKKLKRPSRRLKSHTKRRPKKSKSKKLSKRKKTK